MSPASSSLAHRDLVRVLALSQDAPSSAIQAAAGQLLLSLRRRRDQGDASEPSHSALEQEIAELEAAVARWAPSAAQSARESLSSQGKAEVKSLWDRMSLAGALLGTALMLVVLIAYSSGYRIEQRDPEGFLAPFSEPARLILTGRMPGATLRIMDADRAEVFVQTEAEGASVELLEGRYALDVGREDCPDVWTRSQYFEAGATYRFEPLLCNEGGRLTLVSNTPGDRLQVDGVDLDPRQAEPHMLAVGDHTVRVEKKGYEPYEARIQMGPDQDIELHVELAVKGKQGAESAQGPPPGITPPTFNPSKPVQPVPFDLGDLKQEIVPQDLRARPSQLLRTSLEGVIPGGSTVWHDRISRELVDRFDSDQSGLIDRVEEGEAVSCALWQEIEGEFERGGLGLSMARYYGFDGTEWHPKALGFSRSIRSAAYAKMKECKLSQ
jgi:hypothetical protein